MADEKQPEPAPLATPTEAENAPEPRLHSFVEVVRGPFTGLLGSYEKLEDGRALVRNRDHKTDFPAYVSVLLSHVKQSKHTGGR